MLAVPSSKSIAAVSSVLARHRAIALVGAAIERCRLDPRSGRPPPTNLQDVCEVIRLFLVSIGFQSLVGDRGGPRAPPQSARTCG